MRKTVIIMLAVGIMAASAGYFVAMVLSSPNDQKMLRPAADAETNRNALGGTVGLAA